VCLHRAQVADWGAAIGSVGGERASIGPRRMAGSDQLHCGQCGAVCGRRRPVRLGVGRESWEVRFKQLRMVAEPRFGWPPVWRNKPWAYFPRNCR
jgi:hypothetical protein